MTYSKRLLSGSTEGKGILLSGTTATTSALVHTAVAGVTDLDEVWIYATSGTTIGANLTIGWGGSTSYDSIMQQIPAYGGFSLVVPGLLLQNGNTIVAYADVANLLIVNGYVNRVTA